VSSTGLDVHILSSPFLNAIVLAGGSKKNVLVPRFFLLFSSLDVPYISRGQWSKFLPAAWDLSDEKKYFLTFARLGVPHIK
jgi:hypothetical protein